jgi:hypothetical protein
VAKVVKREVEKALAEVREDMQKVWKEVHSALRKSSLSQVSKSSPSKSAKKKRQVRQV